MASTTVIRKDASIKDFPKDILSMANHLGVLDLAGNALTSIDEIGSFKTLRLLDVSRNALTYLPASLCQVTTLVEVRASKNKIFELRGDVHTLANLKVLDLADNALHVLPTDVGWLQLDTLNLSGNPHLRIPTIVTQLASGLSGVKAVLSYLQVVGEQHRMVEEHLEQFSSPALPHASATQQPDASLSPAALAALVELKHHEVAETGVLDIKRCGTPALLGALHRTALPEVSVADVRYNLWTELPKHIMEVEGLVVCNASHNNISLVNIDGACANLSILNLSFNKVSKMPSSLGNAPALEQLYLANNNLTDLPESFNKLPLVDLFLSENPISAVPKAVLGLAALSKLSMACCCLTSLPAELARIKTLRFLDVSFNMITGLDASLAGLNELSAFNLAFNPLKAFPPVLLSLDSLVECNLDYTGISTLPPGLGALTQLEGLQLEGCPLAPPLDTIYAAQPNLVLQMVCSDLRDLDLSGLLMPWVPTQVALLVHLTNLDLSQNVIEIFPAGLTGLSNLVTLDLSGNKLAALPADIGTCCAKLQVLKLRTNCLASLPGSLCCLQRLKSLVLSDNRLTAIPPALLTGCTALIELDLSSNRLGELPHEIGRVKGLTKLMVNENHLTWLPAELEALTLLEEVSFDNNAFSKVTSGLSGSSAASVQKVLATLLATAGRKKGDPLPAAALEPRPSAGSDLLASSSVTSSPPPSKESSADPIDPAAALRRQMSANRAAKESHLHRLSLDPVRRAAAISPDGGGAIANMSLEIPRIVSFITTNRPAPPDMAPASSSAPNSPMQRPQTMARFKRMMDQSARAKQMLARVDDALAAPPAAAGQGK